MTALVFGAAALAVLGLVLWAGHRMVSDRRSGTSTATAGALGNFIDVFDPARARAERDLDSREHQGEVLPSPDDADLPVRVDLEAGTASVRRPAVSPSGPPGRRAQPARPGCR